MGKAKSMGPSTLAGSKGAKRVLVAILDALSGERGTTEAAEGLGISLSRYYQLETRALQGMLKALEPRPRGRKSQAGELSALKAEKQELEKELRRQRSLLRAAQRSVGLAGARRGKKASSKRRQRGSRGATVRATLRDQIEAPKGGSDGKAERSEGPARAHRNQRAGA